MYQVPQDKFNENGELIAVAGSVMSVAEAIERGLLPKPEALKNDAPKADAPKLSEIRAASLPVA